MSDVDCFAGFEPAEGANRNRQNQSRGDRGQDRVSAVADFEGQAAAFRSGWWWQAAADRGEAKDSGVGQCQHELANAIDIPDGTCTRDGDITGGHVDQGRIERFSITKNVEPAGTAGGRVSRDQPGRNQSRGQPGQCSFVLSGPDVVGSRRDGHQRDVPAGLGHQPMRAVSTEDHDHVGLFVGQPSGGLERVFGTSEIRHRQRRNGKGEIQAAGGRVTDPGRFGHQDHAGNRRRPRRGQCGNRGQATKHTADDVGLVMIVETGGIGNQAANVLSRGGIGDDADKRHGGDGPEEGAVREWPSRRQRSSRHRARSSPPVED